MTTATRTRTSRSYDPDIASVDPATKAARELPPEVKKARDERRRELRDLDEEMNATPGYTVAHIDGQRYMPATKTGALGHPRKRRTLPARGEVRTPVSGWQKRQRLSAARRAQDATPRTELAATDQVLHEDATWDRVNDQLSSTTGDAHALDPTDEQTVRRVDRLIQRSERRNDRGHVVYTNVLIPGRHQHAIDYANTFREGHEVNFDRYTVAAHDIHETEDPIIGQDRLVTFEIATRRGAYLGGGERSGDTHHLLPRGMQLTVVGHQHVRYQRPDGSYGTRTIVQLQDPENTSTSTDRGGRR